MSTAWSTSTGTVLIYLVLGRGRAEKRVANVLFVFHREFRPEPLSPTALQCQNIGETLICHFLCHTGTGILIRSGAVGHIALVFGV